jgi:hypothetical protein
VDAPQDLDAAMAQRGAKHAAARQKDRLEIACDEDARRRVLQKTCASRAGRCHRSGNLLERDVHDMIP